MAKNKSMDFGGFMNEVKDNHVVIQRFTKKDEETPAQETKTEPVVEERRTPGRKPTVMGKKNGKTVYFDDETQNKLRSIKYLQNVDATNVIYTAVVSYLEKHCTEGKLDEKALAEIQEICKL